MADEREKTGILGAIARVQRSVVVPKDKYNDYGGFRYRSFEDIVAALKKPCEEAGLAFSMRDEIVQVGDRYYVKATVTVFFADGSSDETFSTAAYAREAERKTGSDEAQVTGMASSYARKYALCGAFAIDGERDPDQVEPAEERRLPPQQGPFTARCMSCGTRYAFDSAAQYDAFAAAPGCCPAPAWEVE